MFVAGGVFGSLFGAGLASKLAKRKRALSQVFAAIVASVGLYVVVRGAISLGLPLQLGLSQKDTTGLHRPK